MPSKSPVPRLIGGPYAPPPCEAGSLLKCRLRGRLTVAGVTDAPVPWPYAHPPGGGNRVLVLTGDLVRAVRTESVQSVSFHWGVSRWTVTDWRRALGVSRMTPGTTARWRELAPVSLDRAARSRGGKARRQP